MFPGLIGYLNGRRAKPFAEIHSEADVQDLLFVILKPQFPDLVYEEATRKGAHGYSLGDFSLPSLNLIVEAKYVDAHHGPKVVASEIAEDIWKYAEQTECDWLVFFVYDPTLRIPDRANFIRSCSADDLNVRGRQVRVITIVKP